uniref:Selenoprotein T n=1 Tax=Haptolina ericina TaxID=156174 RepID=A0A7S3ADJ9_9EUKA|mmetsp:Transcript_13345/g.30341  ORF Transcript_13345/g.30341 Transcript_13345/m.30341 type:complete len:109 (+) Transcript_13345:215-541(+)
MKFQGETFHPGDLKVGLAQLFQMCFFAGLAIAMGAKKLLPPHVQKLIEDNPMAGMMLIFGCNMASGALLNSGAFEVSYNGQPLWSKIETGRFPQITELKDALTAVAYS